MTQEQTPLVSIPHDVVNEQVIIAAACVSDETRTLLVQRLPTIDSFYSPEHRAIWSALLELERQHLGFDPATLQTLLRGEAKVSIEYVLALIEARPTVPVNLEFHIDSLIWDYTRLSVVRGPLDSFLKEMRNPKTPKERIRALAMAIGDGFDGFHDKRFLLDSKALVQSQIAEIDERMAGRGLYPFGIPGLDSFLSDTGEVVAPRLIPGAAPGLITVVTGVPGSGKTTLTANMALSLARQKKRILYGSWELKSGMTLELLACLSLEMSRTRLMTGAITREERDKLLITMQAISKYVKFMTRPFGKKRGERMTNDTNLDIIHRYIADSGCDVFIGDLWKRCLRQTDPDEEEQALIRQQAICEELNVHGILVHQQRFKDVESRPDKRPTREGLKGSGAYVEVADLILGVHRPALWKRIDDTVLEVDILKQRHGQSPLAIEFLWNADKGSIQGGVSIPYEHMDSSASETNTFAHPRRARRD